MNRIIKRVLSVMLAVMMVLSMIVLPTAATTEPVDDPLMNAAAHHKVYADYKVGENLNDVYGDTCSAHPVMNDATAIAGKALNMSGPVSTFSGNLQITTNTGIPVALINVSNIPLNAGYCYATATFTVPEGVASAAYCFLDEGLCCVQSADMRLVLGSHEGEKVTVFVSMKHMKVMGSDVYFMDRLTFLAPCTATEYVYNNDATCIADGTESAICACGNVVDTRTAEGTMVDHKFVDENGNQVDTCVTPGCNADVQTAAFNNAATKHGTYADYRVGQNLNDVYGENCSNHPTVSDPEALKGKAINMTGTVNATGGYIGITIAGLDTIARIDVTGIEANAGYRVAKATFTVPEGVASKAYAFLDEGHCCVQSADLKLVLGRHEGEKVTAYLFVKCVEENGVKNYFMSRLVIMSACTAEEYTYNNDATCMANGTETGICSCGNTTDARVVEGTMLPHNFIDENGNKVNTCVTPGCGADALAEDLKNVIENHGTIGDYRAGKLLTDVAGEGCTAHPTVADPAAIAGKAMNLTGAVNAFGGNFVISAPGLTIAAISLSGIPSNVGYRMVKATFVVPEGVAAAPYVFLDEGLCCVQSADMRQKLGRYEGQAVTAYVSVKIVEEDGVKSYFVDQVVFVPACTAVEYTYNNDATCMADGTETGICSCGNTTDARVAEGTMLPHNFIDENGNKVNTCVTPGCNADALEEDFKNAEKNHGVIGNYMAGKLLTDVSGEACSHHPIVVDADAVAGKAMNLTGAVNALGGNFVISAPGLTIAAISLSGIPSNVGYRMVKATFVVPEGVAAAPYVFLDEGLCCVQSADMRQKLGRYEGQAVTAYVSVKVVEEDGVKSYFVDQVLFVPACTAVEYTYNNDATCMADGTETGICSCGNVVDTRTAVGTMLPHNFVDENGNAVLNCVNPGCDAIAPDPMAEDLKNAAENHSVIGDYQAGKLLTDVSGEACSLHPIVVDADAVAGKAMNLTSAVNAFSGNFVISAPGMTIAAISLSGIPSNVGYRMAKATFVVPEGVAAASFCFLDEGHCCVQSADMRLRLGAYEGQAVTAYVSVKIVEEDGTKSYFVDRVVFVPACVADVYNYNNDATCMADGTLTGICTCGNVVDTKIAEGTKLPHNFIDENGDAVLNCVNPGCDAIAPDPVVDDLNSKAAHVIATYKVGSTLNDVAGEACPAHPTVADPAAAAGKAIDMTGPVGAFDGNFVISAPGLTIAAINISGIPSNVGYRMVKASFVVPEGVAAAPYVFLDAGECCIQSADMRQKLGWNEGKVVTAYVSMKVVEVDGTKSYFLDSVVLTSACTAEEYTSTATCTEAGIKTGICTVCGNVVTEEVAALGHDIVAGEAVPATCTETGLTAGESCTRCDYAVAPEEVPALGHDIVVDAAAVPATCTETGLTAGEHCTRCDYAVEQEEVPVLGHDIVVDADAVPATCTETGLTAAEHCTRCDYAVEQEEVPALGHNYVDDVCEICGDVKAPAGIAISGTITHKGDTTGEVTIKLLNGATEVAAVTSTNGTYSLLAPGAGTYTLTVAQTNFVTRTYEITVADTEITLDVQIHLKGDINGDGRVNTGDVSTANKHAKRVETLTGYQLLCADVDGNGRVNTGDVSTINKHAKRVQSLW